MKVDESVAVWVERVRVSELHVPEKKLCVRDCEAVGVQEGEAVGVPVLEGDGGVPVWDAVREGEWVWLRQDVEECVAEPLGLRVAVALEAVAVLDCDGVAEGASVLVRLRVGVQHCEADRVGVTVSR